MIPFKKLSVSNIFLFAVQFLLFAGTINAQQSSKQLAGKWRGEFTIRDGIIAPFNFEIKENGKVFLLNGDESFETGTASIINDSLYIPLDQFDNELAFQIKYNTLSGELRRQDHKGTPVPVVAEKGKTYRFAEKNIPPSKNFTGKYEVIFTLQGGKEEKAVGILKQEGNKLTGTFLKLSGDTRFLQGIVEGNNFYLSSFIGSSPGYYGGTFTSDGKIKGEQVGTRIRHRFSGVLNENASLPDPFHISGMKEGYSSLEFSFPDINGNIISLKDAKFKNKVVILAITGTWCPNCIDEAAFLAPWYIQNKERGVEVISIHYERQTDTAFVSKVMRRFRQRFGIQYDQVFGGLPNNDSVSKSLPGLKGFKSFPTTIFINKKGNVDKIHSGFTGPATGKYYDEFVREFNEEIDRLLTE